MSNTKSEWYILNTATPTHGEAMRYTTSKLDITYQLDFVRPQAFIATRTNTLIESLFEKLGSRYAMRSDSIQVLPSSKISDVKVKAELFNGNAKLEISCDRVIASFTNAAGDRDIEVIKDCISLIYDIIASSTQRELFGVEQIRLIAWLIPTVDEESIGEYLKKHFSDRLISATSKALPERAVNYGIKIETSSSTEMWRTTAEISPAWGGENTIFLSYNAIFQPETCYADVAQKAEFFEREISAFLTSLELERYTTE